MSADDKGFRYPVVKTKNIPPNSVPDIPGVPVCHLNSPGTNTEDSELTDWLRENGADEDTISRVKTTWTCRNQHSFIHSTECLLYFSTVLGNRVVLVSTADTASALQGLTD